MKTINSQMGKFLLVHLGLITILTLIFACTPLAPEDKTNPPDTNNTVHNGTYQWESMNGPNGLSVNELATKGDLSFAIAGSNLYISEADEDSWTEYVTSAYGFNSIFVQENRIFAGISSGINVSSDNGLTWKRVLDQWSSDIQVVSGNGNFMLAKGGGTLFSSSDSGNTWTQRSDGSEGRYSNVLLVVGDVALFTGQGYVQRATANLETYTQGQLEDDTARVAGLVEDNGAVYAFSTTEVSVSQDTGISWTKLGDIPQEDSRWCYSVSDDLVLIGTSAGLLISRDKAHTWSSAVLPHDSSEIYGVVICEGKILAGGYDGVFISSDRGITWAMHNEGLAVDVDNLVAADNNLIAGTWNSGIWLSEGRSNSWRRSPRHSYSSVFAMFYNQNIVHAGGWQSSDNGTTWEYYSTERIYDFCVSQGVLFGGTEGNGVIASADGGKTWLTTSFDSKTVYNLLSVGNRVIAATNSGWLRYSDDQGNTWAECKEEYSWYIDDWDVRNDTIFAAVSDSGLYVSPDKGISWQTMFTPYSYSASISALKCTEGDIFVSSYYSGTVNWFDGANAIWKNLGPSEDNLYTKCLEVVDDTVFVGTNRGVYRLSP